jgi:hypothetical protein
MVLSENGANKKHIKAGHSKVKNLYPLIVQAIMAVETKHD